MNAEAERIDALLEIFLDQDERLAHEAAEDAATADTA